MKNVLNKSKTRILVREFLRMYMMDGKNGVSDASKKGQGETRAKRERRERNVRVAMFNRCRARRVWTGRVV
jgi:hypothetical protein